MTSTGEFKKKTTAEQKQHEAYADKHLEDPHTSGKIFCGQKLNV